MPPTIQDTPLYYAHTAKNGEPWETLFTPFGTVPDTQCAGKLCLKCEQLNRSHGHTNKVAFWAATFAASMFPPNSTEAKAAWEWGWLTSLCLQNSPRRYFKSRAIQFLSFY